MPKRREATDRAGMQPGAVEAAVAARLGLVICNGWITDPPHTDAADPPRRRPESRRRCTRPLDPALTLAGFTTHPECDPGEVSRACPPMPWPAWMLGGDPDDTRPARCASGPLIRAGDDRPRRHRWPKHASPGECRAADRCTECGTSLNDAKRGAGPCPGKLVMA